MNLNKENKLREQIKALRKERNRYRSGFNILYEYFDSISDEEQVYVDKKLKRLDL